MQITFLFSIFLIFGNVHLYYSSDSFPYSEIDRNSKEQNILQFTLQVLANTQQQQQKKITYINLAINEFYLLELDRY